MNVFKIKESVTVVLSTGETLFKEDCSKEMYLDIIEHENDEEYVKDLLLPKLVEEKEKLKEYEELEETINSSNYLVKTLDSVTIPTISEVTLPQEFINSFILAESNEDKGLIQSYLNFWALCSQNPNHQARTNLFWFLKKYGMTITASGAFIAYRYVLKKSEGSSKYSQEELKFITDTAILNKTKIKKAKKDVLVGYEDVDGSNELTYKLLSKTKASEKDFNLFTSLGTLEFLLEDSLKKESTIIYTDKHTKKMEITLGSYVSMPRSECNESQLQSCKAGLHSASKEWIDRNSYFGDIPLKLLINPRDVVSVPIDDNYGKLRSCGYYPFQILKTDDNKNIIDSEIPEGIEIDFIDSMIEYNEKVNNTEEEVQKIVKPKCTTAEKFDLDRIKETLSKRISSNE